MKRFLSLTAVAAVFVVALATPSSAEVSPAPVDQSVFQQASDAAMRAKLEALVGKQSKREMLRLATSSAPANLYVSADTGELLAAIATPASISTYGVTWRTPGCAVGDACVYANMGASPYGFYGYGNKLSFSLTDVTSFRTGNRATKLWNSQGSISAPANKLVTLDGIMQMVAISRS